MYVSTDLNKRGTFKRWKSRPKAIPAVSVNDMSCKDQVGCRYKNIEPCSVHVVNENDSLIFHVTLPGFLPGYKTEQSP